MDIDLTDPKVLLMCRPNPTKRKCLFCSVRATLSLNLKELGKWRTKAGLCDLCHSRLIATRQSRRKDAYGISKKQKVLGAKGLSAHKSTVKSVSPSFVSAGHAIYAVKQRWVEKSVETDPNL